MIIALLVIMFIILVVLYNVIEKIKENVEALDYAIDCNFKNDLGIKGLEKTVEELEDDVWALQMLEEFTDGQINRLEERINGTNERVDKIEETVKGIQVLIGTPKVCNMNGLIKADEIKTGVMPKDCSIDGKCNYMDKFTTVK